MDEQTEDTVDMEVPPGYEAGERLDQYLAQRIAGVSRSKVHEAVKTGRVSVNGSIQRKPSAPIQAGDRLSVRLPRPPAIEARPEAIPLDVVYEDDLLLVVDKPAGMVVHPAYGHRTGTLVNALLHHVGGGMVSFDDDDDDELPRASEASEGSGDDGGLGEGEVGLSTATAAPRYEGDVTVRPGIVHRLDKDTSGLLVVAKTDSAHAALARQFMARTIRRHYLGIVWGVPDPPSGVVEAALARDPRERRRVAVASPERGKHAVTRYDVLEAHRHTALVRFRLETGRTHQIRVHAAHLRHPIFGDRTYGGDRIRFGPAFGTRARFIENLFARLPRQALHAASLGFRHPETGDQLNFEAPIPADMAHVLERLRAVEGAA